MKEFTYVNNCISAQGLDITDMVDQAIQITVRTFAKHCDYREASAMLGYGDCPGLTLANDYAVTFHKSKYRGKPCYYICHSAIEYIYLKI